MISVKQILENLSAECEEARQTGRKMPYAYQGMGMPAKIIFAKIPEEEFAFHVLESPFGSDLIAALNDLTRQPGANLEIQSGHGFGISPRNSGSFYTFPVDTDEQETIFNIALKSAKHEEIGNVCFTQKGLVAVQLRYNPYELSENSSLPPAAPVTSLAEAFPCDDKFLTRIIIQLAKDAVRENALELPHPIDSRSAVNLDELRSVAGTKSIKTKQFDCA